MGPSPSSVTPRGPPASPPSPRGLPYPSSFTPMDPDPSSLPSKPRGLTLTFWFHLILQDVIDAPVWKQLRTDRQRRRGLGAQTQLLTTDPLVQALSPVPYGSPPATPPPVSERPKLVQGKASALGLPSEPESEPRPKLSLGFSRLEEVGETLGWAWTRAADRPISPAHRTKPRPPSLWPHPLCRFLPTLCIILFSHWTLSH